MVQQSESTGRGKSFGDTKKTNIEKTWDQNLEWGDLGDNVDQILRFNGPFFVLGRHWIRTLTGKNFPVWCPKFDTKSEEYAHNRVCPMHDDFEDEPQLMYLTTAIFRSLQHGNKAQANPVKRIMLPKIIGKDLRKMCERRNVELTDPDNGLEILIAFDPKGIGKDKYTVQFEGQCALTPAEREYQIMDLEMEIPDYSDPEIAVPHARKMKQSLAFNGYYVQPLDNGKSGRDGYKNSVDGQPYHRFPDLIKKDAQGRSSPLGGTPSGSNGGNNSNDAPRRDRDRNNDDAPVRRTVPVDDPPVARSKPVEEPKPAPKAEVAPPVVESKPVAEKRTEELVSIKPALTEAQKEVAKMAPVPEEHRKWATDYSIAWTAEGQPHCFPNYEGKKKCLTCPVKKKCLQISTANA